MAKREIVSRKDWLAARREHLNAEKALTRARDALSAARRELPWVEVTENYVFEGPEGEVSFADLFEGRHQLIVYHFMFGPEWEAGCKSCSFWADNFERIVVHLNARDASMVAISSAPVAKLDAYKARMGWTFPWVSAGPSTFNADYGVTFASDTGMYNFQEQKVIEELPGISVFYRDDDGKIYHTYSAYSRGLDMLNGAYHYMDLLPKGRDEGDLDYSMSWLRRRDEYAQ